MVNIKSVKNFMEYITFTQEFKGRGNHDMYFSLEEAIDIMLENKETEMGTFIIPRSHDQIYLITLNGGEDLFPLKDERGCQITILSLSHLNFAFITKKEMKVPYRS